MDDALIAEIHKFTLAARALLEREVSKCAAKAHPRDCFHLA